MNTPHDFADSMAWSKGKRSDNDCDTILSMLEGAARVEKVTDPQLDRAGVDYIATLRRGAQVLIDAKGRKAGASRWWRHGEPDLALETHSVVGDAANTRAVGWTLDESKVTDLILYHFDDVDDCYLVGFQHLRMALRRNYRAWTQRYDWRPEWSTDPLTGRRWESRAVFVPASIVLDAILDVSHSKAA